MDAKSDKNLHRLERKAILEAEKRKKPGECMKYVQAIIDESLINELIGSKILASANVGHKLVNAPIPRTIYWQRSVQQTLKGAGDEMRLDEKYQDENILLHIMTATELNSFVASDSLFTRVKSIQNAYPTKELSLIIFGLKEFCRGNRTNVGRFSFETALTELQLMHNISHRLLETAEDVAQVFIQFSKSIAEKLYKKDRDDKMSDQNFYLANDNKDCVQVKDNIGLTNLWKNHLCKFPAVTLDTAEAILKEYPTFSKLIQAYESNNSNGPLLLAEIPIKRSGGALSSTSRKIGAELSRRIHSFYTQSIPDFVLQ